MPPAPGPRRAFARMKEALGAGAGASERRKRMRDALLPHQIDVIDDPATRKSLRVPRRGGKSYTLSAYLCDFCEANPGVRCVFGSITLKSAKRLIWDGADGLKTWDTKYSLGISWQNTSVVATFPNGSVIMVMGFETDADIDKIRGDKLDLVILDECKSFPLSLFKELIEQAIEPALMDKDGTLVLCGTPGAKKTGLFCEASWIDGAAILLDEETKESRAKEGLPPIRYAINRPWEQRNDPQWEGVDFTWSCHSWTIADNTAFTVRRKDGTLVTLWEQAQQTKRNRRWSDDNPIWRREYLGHWVEDLSVFVYRITGANLWQPVPTPDNPLGLPQSTGRVWHFGAGLDLGWEHPTALEVLAWCDDLPFFWQVWEDQGVHLTQKAVVALIRRARDVVGQEFDFIVADTGNIGVQLIASIEEEYGLGIEAARKVDKVGFIEVLNSEFLEGRAFIINGKRLHEEMTALTWDIPRGVMDLNKPTAPLIKKYEDDTCANDHCDAFVYAARRALHKFARDRAPEPVEGSDAWKKEQLARQWAAVQGPRRDRQIDSFGADMRLDEYTTWDYEN